MNFFALIPDPAFNRLENEKGQSHLKLSPCAGEGTRTHTPLGTRS